MTKRNIAIANFSPHEVHNSSWPRFVGFKGKRERVKGGGLFGLVDKNTRMHAYFRDTTIQEVLETKLFYKQTVQKFGRPMTKLKFDDTGKAAVGLALHNSDTDITVQYLPCFTYTDKDGIEWDVYPVVTGKDINIAMVPESDLIPNGYWDMGIWRPTEPEWENNDVYRIEQLTINHVVSLGHGAKTSITIFDDHPDYGKYKDVDVTKPVPAWI